MMCDMPVRWNSSDKMVKAALRMEMAIRAVLSSQKWDDSVRKNLTPTDEDWNTLKEMTIFFKVFSKPTVQSQAELYPTLHNVIPNYIHMIRQMNVWQNQETTPILQIAAKAAYTVLWDYFKKSMATRHSFISLICDPRYKMEVLEYLFDAEGGVRSSSYKKGKLHFQHVYSDYSRRAALIKNWYRTEAENKAADA